MLFAITGDRLWINFILVAWYSRFFGGYSFHSEVHQKNLYYLHVSVLVHGFGYADIKNGAFYGNN